MKSVAERLLVADMRGPLQIRSLARGNVLADAIGEHEEEIQRKLLEHGAILFRGFDVQTPEALRRIVDAMSSHAIDYTYRSTPRTALGAGLYSASEYPADQEIPLHNENAYQREWPGKLLFCCLTPAMSGGETPVADMLEVTRRIGPDLLSEFSERRVEYIRHYRPHVDLPWQVVFQSQEQAALAAFCEQHDIRHHWIDNETLRTSQVCQGAARHPQLGCVVFFNQAHLFHASALPGDVQKSLAHSFGDDLLPRHARFGDGREIEERAIEKIRAAFCEQAVSYQWQAGDVLLLDNMQFAHGRRAYSGLRKVIAALLDPVTCAA